MTHFSIRSDEDKAKKYLDKLQKLNPDRHLGEILIKRGDTDEFDIVSGILTEGTVDQMKMRVAYNQQEHKFFIQISHRKSKESFRIYLTKEEFKVFHDRAMAQYSQVEQDKQIFGYERNETEDEKR